MMGAVTQWMVDKEEKFDAFITDWIWSALVWYSLKLHEMDKNQNFKDWGMCVMTVSQKWINYSKFLEVSRLTPSENEAVDYYLCNTHNVRAARSLEVGDTALHLDLNTVKMSDEQRKMYEQIRKTHGLHHTSQLAT